MLTCYERAGAFIMVGDIRKFTEHPELPRIWHNVVVRITAEERSPGLGIVRCRIEPLYEYPKVPVKARLGKEFLLLTSLPCSPESDLL